MFPVKGNKIPALTAKEFLKTLLKSTPGVPGRFFGPSPTLPADAAGNVNEKDVERTRALGGFLGNLGLSDYDPSYGDQYKWNPETESYQIKQSYQIKEGDTFAKIAEQTGAPEAQLQETSGTMVPPPKGTWITVPTQQQEQQPVPAVEAPVTPSYSPGASQYSQAQFGIKAFSEQAGSRQGLEKSLEEIRGQMRAGKPPAAVPLQLMSELGATPQSLTRAGYAYNTAAREWQLPGAGKDSAAGANGGKIYYSRSRGFVTPEQARLLDKRRASRREKFKRNGTGGAITTLDLHIGGE